MQCPKCKKEIEDNNEINTEEDNESEGEKCFDARTDLQEESAEIKNI